MAASSLDEVKRNRGNWSYSVTLGWRLAVATRKSTHWNRHTPYGL